MKRVKSSKGDILKTWTRWCCGSLEKGILDHSCRYTQRNFNRATWNSTSQFSFVSFFFGKNRLDSSHVFSPFSFFSGWSIDLVFSIFITIFFREGEIVWLMDGSLVAVFFISNKNQWIFQRHYLFFVSLLIFQNSFLFIIKCTSFVRYCLFSKFKLLNSFQYLLFFQDFFQVQFIN